MTLTDFMNIKSQFKHKLKNKLNDLEVKFNIDIDIYTNIRFGEYEQINISGFQCDILSVKNEISTIINYAEKEFNDYKIRKKRKRKKTYECHSQVQSKSNSYNNTNIYSVLPVY